MSSPLDGTSTAFASFQNWLAKPFDPSMSLYQWFLFGGLVLVIFAAWGLILRDLKGAIE